MSSAYHPETDGVTVTEVKQKRGYARVQQELCNTSL